MAKRFTAIILALAMALSLVTVNVFAAPEVEGYEVSKAFEPNATVTLGDWTPIAQYDTNYGIARPDVAAALAAEGAILVVEGTDTVNYLCIQANGWTNNYIGLAQTKSGDDSLGNGVWNADKHYGVFDNDIVKKILAISTETWNSIVLSGSGELVGLYVCVPNEKTEEPDKGGDAEEEEEDDEVLYTLPADKLGEVSKGWLGIVSGAEVPKFTDALSAYGAVLTIKTDITADDISSDGLWFVLAAQSTSDWSNGSVPNGVVETAESGTTLTYKGSDILDFVEEKGWTGAVQFALNESGLTVDTFELISFEVTAPKVEEEKLPDGYVADEKIEVGDDNVEVSADGKTVTVTPDDDLKTEGLLIKFDKPAPADGTVTVNYGEPEKAPEDKVLFTHEWSIESNWHSLNKKWNAADFTKLLEALQVENAVVKVEYTGDQGWGLQIGLKDGDLNKMYTVEGVKHDTATKTATVYAADVYALAAANGMDYETVDNCEFYVNTGHSEAHNLTLSVIVPAEAVPAAASLEEGETASVTASFKAGATFVVVDTSEYKDDAITSVVISVKSGKAPTVSEILVKQAKQKKQGIEGYNGYIVQLGAQYHGLFMGGPRLIPMPHTFVGDTCTACGYHKISLH